MTACSRACTRTSPDRLAQSPAPSSVAPTPSDNSVTLASVAAALSGSVQGKVFFAGATAAFVVSSWSVFALRLCDGRIPETADGCTAFGSRSA